MFFTCKIISLQNIQKDIQINNIKKHNIINISDIIKENSNIPILYLCNMFFIFFNIKYLIYFYSLYFYIKNKNDIEDSNLKIIFSDLKLSLVLFSAFLPINIYIFLKNINIYKEMFKKHYSSFALIIVYFIISIIFLIQSVIKNMKIYSLDNTQNFFTFFIFSTTIANLIFFLLTYTLSNIYILLLYIILIITTGFATYQNLKK